MKTKNYMQELTNALKKDSELRLAWKANIAMAYKDHYDRYVKKTSKKTMNAQDRHIIASDAAEYFLNLLCS